MAATRERLLALLGASQEHSRHRRLVFGVVTGVGAKVMGFVATLLIVPMTFHYLGQERYGVWATMCSLLAWLTIVDLGIANGLTPALSDAYGRDRQDLARQYVATAFWSLLFVAATVGALASVLWSWLDVARLFNVPAALQSEVSVAVAVGLVVFLASIPLGITQRIYLAHQQGPIANCWQVAGTVAGLCGVFVATRTEGNLVRVVLGFFGAPLLVAAANTTWLFWRAKPELRPTIRPQWANGRRVLALGGMFFFIQIATLIIFQTDNLVISHYLGPAHVASYSITWQIFLYATLLGPLVSPYLSPAFGEAHARGERSWMRRAFLRYMAVSCAVGIPILVTVGVLYRPIITAWVDADAVPEGWLVFWMALWGLTLVILHPIIALLNGLGHLRLYSLLSVVGSALNFGLSVLLVQTHGVLGVVIASVVTTVGCMLIPSLYTVVRLLSPIPPADLDAE